jgi:hypothetical protein
MYQQAEAGAEAEPEAGAEAEPEAESEAGAEPVAEPVAEPEAEPEAEPVVEALAEPEAEAEAEVVAEPVAEPEAAVKPEAEAEVGASCCSRMQPPPALSCCSSYVPAAEPLAAMAEPGASAEPQMTLESGRVVLGSTIVGNVLLMCLALLLNKTNRRRVHRLLQRWDRKAEAQSAAAISSMLGGMQSEKAMTFSQSSFRGVRCSDVTTM